MKRLFLIVLIALFVSVGTLQLAQLAPVEDPRRQVVALGGEPLEDIGAGGVGAALAALAAGQYWASAKSEVYHYPDCRYAKSITEIFLIKFKSPEEAIKAGFRPCKVCVPPEDTTEAGQ